jgi:hypothetical protein
MFIRSLIWNLTVTLCVIVASEIRNLPTDRYSYTYDSTYTEQIDNMLLNNKFSGGKSYVTRVLITNDKHVVDTGKHYFYIDKNEKDYIIFEKKKDKKTGKYYYDIQYIPFIHCVVIDNINITIDAYKSGKKLNF